MRTILGANPYGTLDEDRLVQFEFELGVRLPEAYRAFLLEHNGGIPQPTGLVPWIGANVVGQLQEMFYLTPDSGSLEIVWWNTQGRWPEELLAIGGVDQDRVLAIGTMGQGEGCIYLVDDDDVSMAPFVESMLTLLAPSFEEFLARLC